MSPGTYVKVRGNEEEEPPSKEKSNGTSSSNPDSPSTKPLKAPQHIAHIDTTDWVKVASTTGDDPSFYPDSTCVGHKLLLLAESISGEDGSVLMSRTVKTDLCLAAPPLPPKRQLVTAKNIGGSGHRFRVVTYNILAEIYATAQMYPYCDFWALSWDYRFQNMKSELEQSDGDVVCLQEVQSDYFSSHIQPFMNSQGYEGIFKQKTRDAMGMAGKVDGCAMFWRKSKLQCVENYTISFNDLAQRQAQSLGLNPRGEETAQFLNRLKKDNVAQCAVLEFINSTRTTAGLHSRICVVNTHFYSNKDYPDIKLWQAWQLLNQVEDYALSRNLPVLLCGDLNSTPDSAVYDLLSTQAVHPGHPDIIDAKDRVLPDSRSITHNIKLSSAYQSVTGAEPTFTNYTSGFKGTLDYIWYTSDNLRPLSTAPITEEEKILKYGMALPNTQFSSDHVLMLADMQLGGQTR